MQNKGVQNLYVLFFKLAYRKMQNDSACRKLKLSQRLGENNLYKLIPDVWLSMERKWWEV